MAGMEVDLADDPVDDALVEAPEPGVPDAWVTIMEEYRRLGSGCAELYKAVVASEADPQEHVDKMANMVDTLEHTWLTVPRGLTEAEFLRYGKFMFGLHGRDLARVQADEVEAAFSQHHMRTFIHVCSLVCLLDGEDDLKRHVNDEFRRVIRVMTEAKAALLGAGFLRKVVCANTITMCPVEETLNAHSFFIEHEMELEGIHRLLVFILRELECAQLRRFGDKCYKQKYVQDGGGAWRATKYWQEECTIEQFVARRCDKEHHYDMWSIMLAGRDAAKRVRDRLMDGVEREFPELQIDRHLFAFRNGLFECTESRFYPYDAEDAIADDIDDNAAAINYFDMNCYEGIHHNLDPTVIPTPVLDSVFMFQLKHTFTEGVRAAEAALKDAHTDAAVAAATAALDHARRVQAAARQEVVWWVYVLLGRMFFELNVYDNWQICTFIKGYAGTGKSTLGQLLSFIFPHQHIGYIASNIEEQFGLQDKWDKLLWLCLEVKENFRLPLSQLQSMISGEPVTVAIKNKDAKTVIWKSPGMMFGNEIPPWKDRAGALLRRFVMVLFEVPVSEEEKNMNLPEELRAELGCIIPKVTRIYLTACDLYRHMDIWHKLPKWFRECRDSFAHSVDIVARFFKDSMQVATDPAAYAPFDLVQAEFRAWLEQNVPAQKNLEFNTSTCEAFFKKNGIQTVVDMYMWEGTPQTKKYLTGVRWVEKPHLLADSLPP